jgi:hypothetical protein
MSLLDGNFDLTGCVGEPNARCSLLKKTEHRRKTARIARAFVVAQQR